MLNVMQGTPHPIVLRSMEADRPAEDSRALSEEQRKPSSSSFQRNDKEQKQVQSFFLLACWWPISTSGRIRLHRHATLMDDHPDEQGSLIHVSENANWDNYQRMFPFQAAGPNRVLRVQATTEVNPQPEVLLKEAAEKSVYDQVVCGMFWYRDQGVGTAFPLTSTHRQKAVWMTCQHVAKGRVCGICTANLSCKRCYLKLKVAALCLVLFAGDRKFTISTGHNLKYSRDAVKHPVKFKPNEHTNLESNDLPYPADPAQTIRLYDHGDVKAFEVRLHKARITAKFDICYFSESSALPILGRVICSGLLVHKLHEQ